MTLLNLSLTYAVEHIPYRHRISGEEAVRSEGHVVIEEIIASSAPISHRILDEQDRVQAEVRYYKGGYWWLLNDVDKPMTVERFASLARDLDWAVLDALDVPGYRARRSEEELNASRSRILRSERKTQWDRAQRGAEKVLFCDSRVLVEAGPPNFFGTREEGSISFLVGPSSLDRVRGSDPLFGPDLNERRLSARQGLAFDIAEFAQEASLLGRPTDDVDMLYRVEDILQMSVPQMAPERCARELATYLWQARVRPIASHLPSPASAVTESCPADRATHRAVLEEFAALDDNAPKPLLEMREDAREILRRIGLAPTLSEEDDAALAALNV